MSATIHPSIEQRIQRILESGDYTDTDSVINAALQLLELRRQELSALREAIQIGIDEADRGVLIPYSATFWDDLDREVDDELLKESSAATNDHS